jgi:hypothetical protein
MMNDELRTIAFSFIIHHSAFCIPLTRPLAVLITCRASSIATWYNDTSARRAGRFRFGKDFTNLE